MNEIAISIVIVFLFLIHYNIYNFIKIASLRNEKAVNQNQEIINLLKEIGNKRN